MRTGKCLITPAQAANGRRLIRSVSGIWCGVLINRTACGGGWLDVK